MIAKKEWFKPRIFGWGLRPVQWEGWVYIAIVVLLIVGALNLPVEPILQITIVGILIGIIVLDTLVVMIQMYKALDEREKRNQWVIETTASYAGIAAIVGVILYNVILFETVDVGVLIVLGAMVAAKIVTSFYLIKNG